MKNASLRPLFPVIAVLFGCASPSTPRLAPVAGGEPASSPVEVVGVADKVAEEWGIEIVAVRLTAAGHMIDFRYRVTDAAKANRLFDRGVTPYLLDAEGHRSSVPNPAKIGPLRTANRAIEGRTFFMLFRNPGSIQAGSIVAVEIGEFRAEGVVVQ